MLDIVIEETIANTNKNSSTFMPKIKVIGIGGGGNNTINALVDSRLHHIDFIAVNTDIQSLDISKAKHKINIGTTTTRGLGTGDNPELGKKAAEENLAEVIALTEDADVVFLVGGMGGGTGSGALPVIAQALSQKELLTIALVTRPFQFEGKRRSRVANEAIELLMNTVDTLIVVPNQKLLETSTQPVSMLEGFGLVNALLAQSICSIADIITKPGHINVDFADVKTIMKHRGLAIMGTGRASGENRALEAAQQALSCPLIEHRGVTGVQGVLLNISGGTQLRLDEIEKAASIIYQEAHEDAHIIIGSTIDESLQNEVMVTIIATGLPKQAKPQIVPAVSTRETSATHTTESVALQQHTVTMATTQQVNNLAPETNSSSSEYTAQLDAAAENTPIDITNLDVPTFLREEIKKTGGN